jgi:ubiquinone/menaquinone biosynthesis C-methylase UbiE
MNPHQEKIAANKSLWDSRVQSHAASTFYDVPGFLSGKCTLNPAEVDALGDVSGKTLLHLQCHFGLDTLSWARRGAKVTGMDFSGAAIVKARELAAQAGLPATFIEADVYSLPEVLHEKFDIVFTSYGAVTWLPDMEKWADVVRHFLKPGGKFCIAEVHPSWYALNWETYQLEYPYFNSGKAFEETATGSYVDHGSEKLEVKSEKSTAGSEKLEVKSEKSTDSPTDHFSLSTVHLEYFWCHSLSGIIRPLLQRGIRILDFQEFPYSYYNCFPNLIEARPGQWVPKGLEEGKVAMMFLLLGEG